MALQELDMKIEYRPGSSNVKADALSRYPVSLLPRDHKSTLTDVVVVAMESDNEEATLKEHQRADVQLRDIILCVAKGREEST